MSIGHRALARFIIGPIVCCHHCTKRFSNLVKYSLIYFQSKIYCLKLTSVIYLHYRLIDDERRFYLFSNYISLSLRIANRERGRLLVSKYHYREKGLLRVHKVCVLCLEQF